jgi:hypothetical protein
MPTPKTLDDMTRIVNVPVLSQNAKKDSNEMTNEMSNEMTNEMSNEMTNEMSNEMSNEIDQNKMPEFKNSLNTEVSMNAANSMNSVNSMNAVNSMNLSNTKNVANSLNTKTLVNSNIKNSMNLYKNKTINANGLQSIPTHPVATPTGTVYNPKGGALLKHLQRILKSLKKSKTSKVGPRRRTRKQSAK